jgi:hypothetical protein
MVAGPRWLRAAPEQEVARSRARDRAPGAGPTPECLPRFDFGRGGVLVGWAFAFSGQPNDYLGIIQG